MVNMYYITLYVTKAQEEVIQSLYKEKDWIYLKTATPILPSISPAALSNGVDSLPKIGQPQIVADQPKNVADQPKTSTDQLPTVANQPNIPVSTATGNKRRVTQTKPAKSVRVGESKSARKVSETETETSSDDDIYGSDTDTQEMEENASKSLIIKTEDKSQDPSFSDPVKKKPLKKRGSTNLSNSAKSSLVCQSKKIKKDLKAKLRKAVMNSRKTIIVETESTPKDQIVSCYKNKPKDLYKCRLCHLAVKEESYQVAHGLLNCYKLMEQSKTDLGYKCLSCQTIFPTSDSFIWHFLNKMCETKVCNLCGVDEVDIKVFEKHQNTTCSTILHKVETFDGKYMCTNCKTSYEDPKTYMRHHLMEFCKGITLFCDFCGKSYPKRRRVNYNLHLRKHLNDRRFICQECGKAYLDKKCLANHMRKHTGEKPFPCRYDNCNKRFPTEGHRIGHEEANHMDIPKAQVCHICGTAFKFKRGLNNHINLVHMEERNFTCKICSKSFKTDGTLTLHMLCHRTIRDCICEVCGKGFVSNRHLSSHMKRHTDQKKHMCGTCGKSFFSRACVIMHERTHTGSKPYSCRLCDYRCAVRVNLNKHIRGVHGMDNPSLYVVEINDY